MGLGEFYSLAAALTWAFAIIFLRKAGESVSPFALNLFRVGFSGVIFVALIPLTGTAFIQQVPLQDYLMLALSGFIGISVSDTLLHRALNLVGAGINAVVDCLYSPLVALFAFALIGEQLGRMQIGGMVLVIGAVVIATNAKPPAGATHRDILKGIGWGVLAMITLAIGIVIAKPVLVKVPVLWATTLRQAVAFVALALMSLGSARRRRAWKVFVPQRSWRFVVPATLLGSVMALLFWIGGMKYTETGVAAVLNQTSTVFVLVLATLILKEPFGPRRFLAATLATTGILLVTLY